MGEGILLFDGNTSILLELVRPEQRENGVLVVSENDVATGIELDQNMVGILALAKRQVDDTIDAQLIDSTELFRPQMFPQLHGKTRWDVFLVLHVFCRVNADARLDQQVVLSAGPRHLEQVQTTRYIVDIRHSETN